MVLLPCFNIFSFFDLFNQSFVIPNFKHFQRKAKSVWKSALERRKVSSCDNGWSELLSLTKEDTDKTLM